MNASPVGHDAQRDAAQLAAAFVDLDSSVLAPLWRATPDLRVDVIHELTIAPPDLVDLALDDGSVLVLTRAMERAGTSAADMARVILALNAKQAFSADYQDVLTDMVAESVRAGAPGPDHDEMTLVDAIDQVQPPGAGEQLRAAALGRNEDVRTLGWQELETLADRTRAADAVRWLTTPVGRTAPPSLVKRTLERYDRQTSKRPLEDLVAAAAVVWFHPHVGPWAAEQGRHTFTAQGAALLGHLPSSLPDVSANRPDLWRAVTAMRPEVDSNQRHRARAAINTPTTTQTDREAFCDLPREPTDIGNLSWRYRRKVLALSPTSWADTLVAHYMQVQLLVSGSLTLKQEQLVRARVLNRTWRQFLGPIAAVIDPPSGNSAQAAEPNPAIDVASRVWEGTRDGDTDTRSTLAVAAVATRLVWHDAPLTMLPEAVRASVLPTGG